MGEAMKRGNLMKLFRVAAEFIYDPVLPAKKSLRQREINEVRRDLLVIIPKDSTVVVHTSGGAWVTAEVWVSEEALNLVADLNGVKVQRGESNE